MKQIFNKIKEWFKKQKSIIHQQDPVKECNLYKDEGCVFVDGPFCDFPHCSMNNNYTKPNIIVFSQHDFEKFCTMRNITPNNVDEQNKFAFISIIGTPLVLKEYLHEEDTCHYFIKNSENVLNLEFDDIGEDMVYKGIPMKTITSEQASQCVEFIERNLGKTFICHCRAGKSRSQSLFRFITDFYEQYRGCKGNLDNPCLTPNMGVLSALKRAYYKKYNIFVE